MLTIHHPNDLCISPSTATHPIVYRKPLPSSSSPLIVNGYITPPDSRENSPCIGTQTTPKTTATAAFPHLYTPEASPVLSAEETFSGSPPEYIRPAQGTFGRADSRLYLKSPPETPQPQSPLSSDDDDTEEEEEDDDDDDDEAIDPLPATVYVPGVDGDTVSQHHHHRRHKHRRERSLSDPTKRFGSIYHTSPIAGMTSPSSSSPALAQPQPQEYQRTAPVSSQAELIGLWKAAQGGKDLSSGRTYVLNMYRQPAPPSPTSYPEHLTFGADSQTPFYTTYAMRADATDSTFSELTFLRRNPISSLETSVITLSLEPPARRIDGLVTLIYPKQAVLSALSPPPSSASASVSGGSGGGGKRRAQNEHAVREAIQKAYATECCRLGWDEDRRRFYLYHPGVRECGDAYLVEVSGEVGFDHGTAAKGCVKLINVDTNETITELDLGRGVLRINTGATAGIASAHIVDVAVATVLTVATVEGRRMRMLRMGKERYSDTSATTATTATSSGSGLVVERRGLRGLLKRLCF